MALIYEWGFFVEPGVEEAFREWLITHEAELGESAPQNLEYLGTYRPLWAAQQRCDYYQLWRWGKVSGFDMREQAGTSSAFAEVARQFLSFVDESRQDEETFRLHRSVTDERVTG